MNKNRERDLIKIGIKIPIFIVKMPRSFRKKKNSI